MTLTDPAARPVADAPLDGFRGDRVYLGADHVRNERRTWLVAAISVGMLVAQVAGGLAFHSMALLAGGLHAAAHVAALLVAALAYGLARRFSADGRFSFGTGKVGYLAGFANAVVLAITAVTVLVESVERLFHPEDVNYASAIPLAAGGLVVTLVCAWLLKPPPVSHAHDRDGDLNLSVAHFHLSADAAVSTMALIGLGAGQALGWAWADPAAGLLGAGLIAHFAVTLLRRAGAVLLDMNPSATLAGEIRTRLQHEGERIVDLHLWRLGPGHHAAIVVIAADHPQPTAVYRARLADLPGLSHLTIEVR